MALTTDILKKVEGLTEDQIKKIAELSANDENAVMAQRIGELHSRYDEDFSAALGVEKPSGVKSYHFWPEKIKELKNNTAGDEVQKELERLKAEKETLQKQIKEGKADGALKSRVDELEKALTDKESQVKKLQSKLEADRSEWESKLASAQKQAQRLRVEHEFDRALTGLKFKDSVPEAVRNTYLETSKESLLSQYQPDWVKGSDGKETLVFRDANGEILRNADKGLNPYTPGDLLMGKIAELIDTGKQANGAGTKGGQGKPGSLVSLSGVRTQSEAAEVIHAALMEQGLPHASPQYQEAMDKAWTEHRVSELPTQ